VRLVIEPEPDPKEQQALTLALERLVAGERLPAPYRSVWRQAAILENVEDDQATARPRSSPGATRA
jgi:hypothetical protein